ncbi:enoyl-CoA hydratase/carnithine racemase [Inhella inkyongensis]|uniref:Enoyl-CoA hydratase/carnithine racemase n=1 Tax=Inhella inkyongensis TaxID=392593 RepID=A0A840SB66_9BURK|nr:enoyl-CoA hydratase/isomerase family protein [Inhella inkyongensis]MBB5206246.1 enoyl-CoA hydratase/carnithine racemase [Inhella inkyongensis]
MQHALSPALDIDGPVATVTLRRPALANRLELEDLQTLEAHAIALEAHQEVRVVVLQAQGPHFCSGFHIDAVPGVDAPALFEALCSRWESLPAITIAALQGGVWGGATDLALACDFRLGTPKCQMAIPAAQLGLHYYGGGMRRLVSRLGLGPAKRLLLAAQTLDAQAMLRTHFLDELLGDPAALEPRVQALVAEIRGLAPLALRGMKQALNRLAAGQLDLDELAAAQQRCAASADLKEGVAAWQARRSPCFQGI